MQNQNAKNLILYFISDQTENKNFKINNLNGFLNKLPLF